MKYESGRIYSLLVTGRFPNCRLPDKTFPPHKQTDFLANVLRYVRYMLSAVRLLSVCCL